MGKGLNNVNLCNITVFIFAYFTHIYQIREYNILDFFLNIALIGATLKILNFEKSQ